MTQAAQPHLPVGQDFSRYIPLNVDEVIDLCSGHIDPAQQDTFVRFARLMHAWYHHQFLHRAQQLKASFGRGDIVFGDQLDQIVRNANFEAITREDLDNALAEESIFKLRLQVNFDDFDDVVFYRRGPSSRRARVKRWFGLSSAEIEFTNYELVLVYVRFRSSTGDADNPPFEPGSALLKLFKNVPKADLEMLFPNSQVRMRNMDKLLIGVPAFVSGIAIFTSKIGGTLLILSGVIAFWLGLRGEPVTLDQSALAALLTGATALGGYLWKQYSNFKNRKIRFMKALTENLYFKTVADNEGVISYLLDQAEDAETKEVLLAYTAITVLRHPTAGEITAWVSRKLPAPATFDTADAISKLSQLDLVSASSDTAEEPRYSIIDIGTAFAAMDKRWDDLFGPG